MILFTFLLLHKIKGDYFRGWGCMKSYLEHLEMHDAGSYVGRIYVIIIPHTLDMQADYFILRSKLTLVNPILLEREISNGQITSFNGYPSFAIDGSRVYVFHPRWTVMFSLVHMPKHFGLFSLHIFSRPVDRTAKYDLPSQFTWWLFYILIQQ